MASPSSAVHRTGPHPVASDYSKTLLQALAEPDGLRIGSVSRVQLLLTSLVERVHDAIYVLPRHARESMSGSTSTVAPDPEEYAKDVALAIRSLQDFAKDLPDDEIDPCANLVALNQRLVELRAENLEMLRLAKEAEVDINRLIGYIACRYSML